MSFRSSKVILPLAIIALAGIVAWGLYLSKPAPKVNDITPAPLLVDAIEVAKQDIQVSVRAQGSVMPRTATTLVAEVAGRIVEVSEQFKVGNAFKQGDALLRIDQRDYLSKLKRAEAAVASARSELATEQGRAEVAYQDWLKYRSSVKRTDAATELALRKPQLQDAQANLDAALADLQFARDQLDRTVIRAPYDGIVKTKQVDIGQYLNVGHQIGETFAIDSAELRLAIPQHKLNYLELPDIAEGNQHFRPAVTLSAEVGDQQLQWAATIVRTESVFDQNSRVLFAVAQVDDPYRIHSAAGTPLRIGTFVDAEIQGKLFKDLVVLPRRLLRAGNRVWVIDPQNRLQNRTVSLLRTDGAEIYISGGLDSGEKICASAVPGAMPGTVVRIAQTSSSRKAEQPPTMPESTPRQQPLPAAEIHTDTAAPSGEQPAKGDKAA